MSKVETDVSRVPTRNTNGSGRIFLLPVFVFGLLLLGGFCVTAISLLAVPIASWSNILELKQVLSGESTRRFTNNLNENFVLSKGFGQIERAIAWNLIGDTGSAVRVGCPGWFFLGDEFEIYPSAQSSESARANLIIAVARSLIPSDTHLVISVVPDKARVEASHLCNLHRPNAFLGRLDNWVATLKRADINVVSLEAALGALPGDRYYRTDSHWNEAGANAAAAAVAGHLHATQLLPLPVIAPDKSALTHQFVDRAGDLLRVANLDGLPAWLRPPVEKTQFTTIAANIEPVATTDVDLFGDEGLPAVVVVGTSFSRASNFVPFLAHHLASSVANLAKDGGDFEGAAIAYFRSASFRQTPPKVILWEVPERMLQKPLTASERQWLSDLKK